MFESEYPDQNQNDTDAQPCKQLVIGEMKDSGMMENKVVLMNTVQ